MKHGYDVEGLRDGKGDMCKKLRKSPMMKGKGKLRRWDGEEEDLCWQHTFTETELFIGELGIRKSRELPWDIR